jgi:tRNA pseudouridine55 synthase
MEDGIVLLVDKPYGWTSFDVVKKIRNALKIKKVGHAGTLDPLATGLLIICAGKMTKQIDTFQQQEKEYTGTFVIGKTTESFDLEKEVVEVADISQILGSDILSAVAQLTGNILQIPPMHSAIRKEGKRVYESARKGITLELEARPVIVHAFEITGISLPEINFRVVCSKGTYIRSLARDLGDILGVGAYLSALTRTRIGNYRLDDAKSVPDLIDKIKGGLYENL